MKKNITSPLPLLKGEEPGFYKFVNSRCYFLVLLLFGLLNNNVFSQQYSAFFNLNKTPDTGVYIARDYINLLPGFDFKATTNNTFDAKIRESIILNPGYTLTNPVPTTNITIDKSLPVATIPGKAGVNEMGAANYEIPIPLPPGTHGIVPNISILYNNLIGNGKLGLGWDLMGISAVRRTNQIYTINNNGNTTDYDFFALDSTRLIFQANNTVAYGEDGAKYRTEDVTYDSIVTHTSTGSDGPTWFEVFTPDGTVMEYGNTNNSRMPNTTGLPVLVWKINKVTDRFGNYMLFNYTNMNNENVIESINYTGNYNNNLIPYNKVQFYYEIKNGTDFNFQNDVKVSNNLVLKTIKIYAEDAFRDQYDFDYYFDTHLNKIKLYNIKRKVDETTINSTKIIWDDVASNYEVTGSQFDFDLNGMNKNKTHKYCTGDFNGDGKSDILVAEGENDSSGVFNLTRCMMYLSANTDSSTAFVKSDSIYMNSDFNGFVSFTASDINGDGRDEIILKSAGDSNYVYRFNDTTLITTNKIMATPPMSGNTNSHFMTPENIKVDFDGNGKTDLISISNNGAYDAIDKIIMNGKDSNYVILPTFWTQEYKVKLIHFGNNAKTNLMFVFIDQYRIFELKDNEFTLISGGKFPTLNDAFYTGDFNGDGKTDIIVRTDNNWQVYYATGTGFTDTASIITAITGSGDSKYTVVDLNEDGKDDLLETNLDGSINMYLSNSDSFRKISNVTTTNEYKSVSLFADFNGDGKKDLLQVSNSTYKDVNLQYFQMFDNSAYVKSIYDGYNNQYRFTFKPLTNNVVYKNNYNDISTSEGKVSTIPANYYAVSNLKFIDNTNTTISNENYTYYGLREFNNRTEFDSISKQNDISGAKLTLIYDYIGNHKKHIVYENRSYAYDNTSSLWVIIKDDFYWGYFETSKESGNYNYDYSYDYLNLNKWDFSGGTYTDIERNNYNQTWDWVLYPPVKIIYFDNSVSVTATITNPVAPIYAPWFPNSQVSSDTIKRGPPEQPAYMNGPPYTYTYIRTKTYTYYDNGNLKYMQMDASNDTFNIKTEYTDYNPFGYPRKVIIHPPTLNPYNLTDREEVISYDDNGRFITSQSKFLDGTTSYTTTFTNEPKFGNLTQSTDQNGLVTNYEYDKLGRKIKTIYPDHTIELISYEWANGNDPTNAMYKVTVKNTNTIDATIKGNPDVVTYYDALNRSVQTQSVSLNGETISSKVTYNAKGQVSQASLPYFENTTPQYTTFAYDYLGRKTQQIIPDGTGGTAGTTSNITYNDIDLTATVVSGKNSQTQTNITKTNAFGQVVSVTNNIGKTINYTYDLMGRLTDTWTNGIGAPLGGNPPQGSPDNYDYHNGMEYNFHGKRKKLVDMSLGTIASTYDAYDQLRSETNGRDTITKYDYDNLGRVISRTVVSSNDPSATNFETTTYTYGNNNDDSHITTFGKLLSVSTTWSNTFNGSGTVSDVYSYDYLGRLSTLTKSIAGDKTYTESYTYDAYGRLNTLTYPGSNLIIQQTYKNGQLYQVNKMDGQNVALTIWEAKTKDNFGNITQYNLGNGLQTNKVFDQYTGMLNQIKTGTSSTQTSIQNLQYQYDDLYNITQRKDVLSNQQDLFTYDNLNRLTEIQTFPNASQTTYTSKVMAYDDFGNITNKSGVGDMTYGVANDPNNPDPPVFASPYQINQIINNPNTITTPQNILYTTFNKVRKITTADEDGGNAKELGFVYGADYGRRKTMYKLNGNVTSTKYYAFGNYEEELNTTSGIKKDYYIYGGDGVAAIYRISGLGSNTTNAMYYIHKDNLGSFDKVTNNSGTVVDSYSFDAWGNRRSVTDWTAAESSTTTNNHLFTRGFTGHEHLDEFGLINMNGRCYDPLLGRILSPDPDLQDPSNIQNYNRYSYCLNNPLKYTDPSGYKHFGDSPNDHWGEIVGGRNMQDWDNGLTFDNSFNDFWGMTSGYCDYSPIWGDNKSQGSGAGGPFNGEDKSNTNVATSGNDCTNSPPEDSSPLRGAPSNVISAYNDNKDDIDFICDLLGYRLAGYSIGARVALGPLGYSRDMGYISDNTGNGYYFETDGWALGLDASVGINFYLMPTDFKVQNFENRSAQLNVDIPDVVSFSFITDIQHGAEMDQIATRYGGFVFSLGAGIGGSFGLSNTINNGQTPWQNSVYSNGLINWANWLNIW